MIADIQVALQPIRQKLINHPVYQSIESQTDVCQFMEIHAYAVWDFMSLLKALQQKLSCVEVPWKPIPNTEVARFINEIVLGEETDIDQQGIVKSHYELYLDAMASIGANTNSIKKLVNSFNSIADLLEYIANDSEIPSAVKSFLSFTFNLIQEGKAHKIAAAFTFGREDLIPDIFTSIIKGLNNHDGALDPLIYYLERHIELDGDEHGPLSIKMIELLCGNDQKKWQEVQQAGLDALEVRLLLWDEIHAQIAESELV